MKNFKFLKKLLVLALILIASSPQMWATYYYRGGKNGWGATAMTNVNGIYSYYLASSGGHQFKISTTTGGYDYNYTYVTAGYKNTDISEIGDYDKDNCNCWYTSGAHYILVFNPNTSVNSTNKPVICAATALPSAGFESDGNTMSYYNNVDGDVKSSALDRTNGSTIDLTSKAITSLFLKAFNTKMYQHYEVNLLGASNYHFYYKIHRTAVAPGSTGFTEVTSADDYSAGSVTWGDFDGSKYRKPTYYVTADQSLLTGLGSGLYTMSYYFTHVGTTETYRLPSTSGKYNQLKWKILPPALGDATKTSDGSGSGTSGSPYLKAVGGTLRISISDEDAPSDANSALYVSFDGGDTYSSTTYIDIDIEDTDKHSVAIKAKYYNSADALSGTVYDFGNVYYQGTVVPSLNWAASSPVSPTTAVAGEDITLTVVRANSSADITYYYSTNSGSTWTSIETSDDETCTFTTPANTGATQSYIFKAEMSDGGTKSTGNSSAATVYGKKVIHVRDNMNWGTSNIKIHYWGSTITGTDWPGTKTGISSMGGQWFNVVVLSCYDGFQLTNGSGTYAQDQTVTLLYTGSGCVTDDAYYTMSTNQYANQTLSTSTKPTAPTSVTTSSSAPTGITDSHMTIHGSIGTNGNDNITDYGFYYGTTNACGTKAQVGTSNTTGAISKQLTSLTAGTTYYFKTYATNGQGTSYGDVQSYKVPYKVTISTNTGCTSISPTGTQYTNSTISVTATKTTGYTFSSWSITNGTETSTSSTSTTNTIVFTPSSNNATIRPVYTEDDYPVSVSVSPAVGGSLSPTPSDGKITVKQVTGTNITANKNTNYVFDDWTISGGGITPTTSSTSPQNFKATTTGGTIQANFSSQWTIAGTMTDPAWKWDKTSNLLTGFTTTDGKTYATVTISLAANTTYTFKVKDRSQDKDNGWYGIPSGSEDDIYYSDDNTYKSVTTATGNQDIVLHTAAAGDYVFRFNITDKELAVDYPTSYQIRFGGYKTEYLEGADGTTEGGSMSATTSGGAVVVNDGDYVPAGASVTISADETAGYHSVAWYNNADFAEGHKYTGYEEHVHVGTDASYIQFTSISEDKTVWLKYKENKLTLYISPFLASVEVYDVGGSVVKETIDGLEPIYVGVHTGKKLKVIPDVPYYFTGWELAETPKYNIYKTDGSGAAPAENEDYAEVNVYATSECTSDVATQTLYASCKVLNSIYFRNEKEDHTALWDSVYVGFDATWSNSDSPKGGKLGASTKGKTVLPMEKAYGNVWMVYIPRAVTRAEYHNVAFFDKGEMRGWNEFYGNNAVYRTDFDNSNDGKLNMYVPYHVKSSTDNTTTYYSTGYWKTAYTNSKDAGYYLVWRKSENTYDSVGTFVGMSDNKISCTLRLDNTSFKHYAIYDANGKRHVAVSDVTSTNFTDIRVNINMTSDSKFGLTPTAEGNYVFTLDQSCDTMKLSVEFPVAVNDYVIENAFNDGSAKTTRSNVIKASDAETKTRYSMFISNAGGAATLKLRKCTSIDGSGNAVWSEGYADNLSGILSGEDFTPGVYQFDLTIDKANDRVSEVDSLRLYTGNFYIKTDAADGGWVHYKRNILEKNTVNFDRTSATYDHYMCKYFESKDCNIKSVIANDYCNQLSDTVKGDGIARMSGTEPYVPVDGTSIRFSYNSATNETKRAYLGASEKNDFLNLVEDQAAEKVYRTISETTYDLHNITGYDNLWKTKFADNGNFVYEMDLTVKPSAQAGVSAAYTDASKTKHDQVLIPSTNILLGGSSSSENEYSIRIVYDFKTNFMMSSFILNGSTINENLSDFDMLWVRHKDESATQLTLGTGKSLSRVRPIGAIEFRYDSVCYYASHTGNWQDLSSWNIPGARPYLKYFVSFPFDVEVNSIFGLNQVRYGRYAHYVIQKYNGEKRAKEGLFFGDGDNYWEDLEPGDTLKANEGYCVIFDNEYVSGTWDHMWENKGSGSRVYLYFPAIEEVASITNSETTVTVPKRTCNVDRTYTVGGKEKNHKITDSHWSMIGLPLFHDSYIKTFVNSGDSTLKSFYYMDLTSSFSKQDWKSMAITKGETKFPAMSSVLVQWCGTITWTKDAGVVAAPRRNTETQKNYLAQLDLWYNGLNADRTYVSLAEEGDSAFVLRDDMCKVLVKGKPNIYTFAGNYDVAYNEMPLESCVVPVGIVARKNGTYTISMPSNFSGTVTLIDKFEQTRTDLGLEDYEVYLESGTIDDRFELEINIQNAPTAIDGASDGQGSLKDGKAHKFIMNDLLYILNDGVLYDARGNRVK